MPTIENQIAVYDIEQDIMEYISLNNTKNGYLLNGYIKKNDLWMIMDNYPNDVIKVDLGTKRIYKSGLDWEKIEAQTGYGLQNISKEDCGHICLCSHIQNENCCISLKKLTGYLVIHNFYTEKSDIIKVPGYEKCKFSSLCIDGKYIWLSIVNESILVKFDMIDHKVLEEIHFGIPFNMEYIEMMVNYKDNVLLVRETGIFYYNKENGEWKELLYTKKLFLSCSIVYGNRVIFLPQIGGKLILFDLENKVIYEREFQWNIHLNGSHLMDLFDGYIYEDSCHINDYLKILIHFKAESNEKGLAAGSAIWECCKGWE